MNPEDIKKQRLAQNVTLLELAAKMGLPADYIRNIEDGSVVALDSDLERLWKALKSLKTP